MVRFPMHNIDKPETLLFEYTFVEKMRIISKKKKI